MIEIKNLDLDKLIYWNEKLTTEINERISQTLCPNCMNIIGEIGLSYCSNCGQHIEWIWE